LSITEELCKPTKLVPVSLGCAAFPFNRDVQGISILLGPVPFEDGVRRLDAMKTPGVYTQNTLGEVGFARPLA